MTSTDRRKSNLVFKIPFMRKNGYAYWRLIITKNKIYIKTKYTIKITYKLQDVNFCLQLHL